MLLEAGATVDGRARGGRHRWIAIEAEHAEVIDLLELAGTSSRTDLIGFRNLHHANVGPMEGQAKAYRAG